MSTRQRRDPCALVDRHPAQQTFDSLVRVAETLLETHDGFAARREAEMPRLDDPGMHGSDRNLMQARTLRVEELIPLMLHGQG